jgi:hypothetical protein
MKDFSKLLLKKVEEIERRDPEVSNEFKAVREGRQPTIARKIAPLVEIAPEIPDPKGFVLETIVLRTGRPVLAIRQNKAELIFNDKEDSKVWKDRLVKARVSLQRAIRAVGRVEVKNHPRYEWIGTGWLVAPDTVVTNRHVAMEFGRNSGQQFVFKQGVGAQLMEASIDFLEEFDRVESLEFFFERILHIEGDEGPDIAFIQVRPVGDKALAKHIELSDTTAKENEFVAVIGYPARDSRIPEQALMIQIFGDQFDKKRLAPGQITGVQSQAVLHDCSTLGGNSGSVVLSLKSGEALGLHFAGRFLEANYAVPAQIIAERLNNIRRAVGRPVPSSKDKSISRALGLASSTPDIKFEFNWAGGVLILSHNLAQKVIATTTDATQIVNLLTKAAAAIGLVIAPPISAAIAAVSVYLNTQRELVKIMDKGNGVYLTLPYPAIWFQQWWFIVITSR